VNKRLIKYLLERPQRGTKAWWLRVAMGAALLAASLFFLGYVLYRGRETLWQTLAQVDWRLLGLAFVVYPLGFAPVIWAWHTLMARIGGCSNWRTNVRLYCLSCLPKRIPSSIWYIASRVVLYRDQGVDSALTWTATALETIWLVLSGLSVFLLSLPFWSVTGGMARLDGQLIAVGAVCLVLALTSPLWSPLLLRAARWLLARMGIPVSVRLAARDVLPLLGLSALAWVGGGVVLYVLANAVTPVPLAHLPTLVGAWAASGAISLSAGLLVSGMGLREVTLTVLLGSLAPLPVAVAVALLFRVLLMVGEFIWALVFAAFTGGIRRITLKDY
jgi:uncharacterized membrane protein YbhN (UPF0104 family)